MRFWTASATRAPSISGLARVGEKDGGLECGERGTSIPGRQLDEVVERVGRERHAERSHPSLGVDDRELQQTSDLLGFEGLETEEETPRDQRADEAVVRILGGRADQGDRAVLDRRQEDLLLRLVPAMDLVDEQDRPEERRLGVIHHPASVRDAGADRGELLEVGADRHREQVGQGGLPGARGTPQDRGGQVPTVDQLREGLAFSEKVVMSDELLEIARTHPRRKRSIHN